MLSRQGEQVLPIAGLAKIFSALEQVLTVDPAALVGDFFQARDFQALAVLDGLHILRSLQQAVMGTGVEPGEAPAKALNL